MAFKIVPHLARRDFLPTAHSPLPTLHCPVHSFFIRDRQPNSFHPRFVAGVHYGDGHPVRGISVADHEHFGGLLRTEAEFAQFGD